MGRTSAAGGSRPSPRRPGLRPRHPPRAWPLALDSSPLRVVGKARLWLRAAPAERCSGGQGWLSAAAGLTLPAQGGRWRCR